MREMRPGWVVVGDGDSVRRVNGWSLRAFGTPRGFGFYVIRGGWALGRSSGALPTELAAQEAAEDALIEDCAKTPEALGVRHEVCGRCAATGFLLGPEGDSGAQSNPCPDCHAGVRRVREVV